MGEVSRCWGTNDYQQEPQWSTMHRRSWSPIRFSHVGLCKITREASSQNNLIMPTALTSLCSCRKTSPDPLNHSIHIVLSTPLWSNRTGPGVVWSCVQKVSAVECQSIPSIRTQLILDWHSINTCIDKGSINISVFNRDGGGGGGGLVGL